MTTFEYVMIGLGIWVVIGYVCLLTMFIKSMHKMHLRFSSIGWRRQLRFMFAIVNTSGLVRIAMWPALLICMSDLTDLISHKMILQMHRDAIRKHIYGAQAYISGGEIVLLADNSGLAWVWDSTDGWTPRVAVADENVRRSTSEIVAHPGLPRLHGWNFSLDDEVKIETAHA